MNSSCNESGGKLIYRRRAPPPLPPLVRGFLHSFTVSRGVSSHFLFHIFVFAYGVSRCSVAVERVHFCNVVDACMTTLFFFPFLFSTVAFFAHAHIVDFPSFLNVFLFVGLLPVVLSCVRAFALSSHDPCELDAKLRRGPGDDKV